VSHRPGLAANSVVLSSAESLKSIGGRVLQTLLENEDCSSELTRIAEDSAAPQALWGATKRSLPPDPMLAIWGHCSGDAPGEQLRASQSDAHIGATNTASTVTSAKAIALSGRERTGVVSLIIPTSRYAAMFQPSILIPPLVPISSRDIPLGLLSLAKYRVVRIDEKSGSRAAALQIATSQNYAGLSDIHARSNHYPLLLSQQTNDIHT